jgi:hypothetical protein
MSILVEQDLGRYIYGIIRSEDETHLGEAFPTGLNGESLEVIRNGSLAAIVSPTEIIKLRPQRKLLAAHQQVVDWLNKSCTMLPVAFGLIADHEADVESLLEKHQQVLNDQLDLVDGRVEMMVTLRWSAENIFQFFVENSEALRAARDHVASGNASRDELIEAGRLFEGLLAEQRTHHSETVLEHLRDVAVSIDEQPVKQEHEILRAAFLVPREDVEQFESALFDVAKKFDENFAFSFNGPWPPYSFVKLNLANE